MRLPLALHVFSGAGYRMKLLAFETSTEACSVALHVDGKVLSRHAIAPRRHAELVLPWADEVMAEAGIAKSQLDAVACTRGPGAFTGVRLGIAVTQGIALALDRPVIAASSLRVLIEPFLDAARDARAGMLALLDARMGELYVAGWSAARLPAAGFDADASGADALAESLHAPGALCEALPRADNAPGWIVCGSGVPVAAEALRAAGQHITASHADALPHAEHLARVAAAAFVRGEAIDAAAIRPVYLRNDVALTIAQRLARTQPV